jgi:hypothetical protein
MQAAVRPLLAAALLAPALAAHALCTSEGVPEPAAVLERFISADCEACWRDPATPAAAAGTLAIDWIVPGRKGEDAPLAAVASSDSVDRLRALRRPVPEGTAAVFGRRSGAGTPLRIALGDAFNDYVGTSIELARPGREPWQAWLLLVESLPAGVEGSPVARNVVRNVFRPAWDDPRRRPAGPLAEARPMQIHEGARPSRLRLVAVLQDARGRMRAIRQTACRE